MNIKNKVTGELSTITTYDPATGEITGLVPIGNTTLGSNANVIITGGGAGEVLSTDGAGNLSWAINSSYSNTDANAFMAAGLVGNITPAGNNIFSLGNATNQWKDLWVSNSTIYINSVPIGINSSNTLTVGNANVVTTSPSGTTATVGVLTVTGNIIANTGYYFLGDGGLLGNLPVQSGTYSNANVANYLPTYTGNFSAGNAAIINRITANTVSLGTGNLSLTGNRLATTSATITIDPLNDGTNNGNVVVAGNLTVGGTLTYNNTVSATTNDLQWIAANNAVSSAAATGAGLSVGPTGSYASFTFNAGANAWQSSLPIIAGGGVNANGSLSGATTGTFTGNVTAPFFIGNGSQLTGLYANTNVANYLPTYTGNVGAGNVVSSGNIVAARFIGDGSALTNLPIQAGTYSNANVTAYLPTYLPTYLSTYLPTYTGNISSGNVTTTGRITTTNLTVTGNSALGSVANVIITGGTGGQVLSTNGAGALTWITPAGTYTNANVAAYLPTYTGNITAGNVTATGNIQASFFIGNGSQLTGLPIQPGTYSNANVAAYLPTYAGNISADNVITTTNVQAAYFIGDGSQLTGLPAGYTNSDVANYLPTYTGNLNSLTGNITTTADINAANLTVSDINATNLTVVEIDASNLTVVGNTSLGNVGNVSITGGNIGEVLSTDGTGNLTWTPNPIYVVPAVYLTATSAGNNQTFSNTILASYNSNADMTVFYNGALLENTYYTLSGDAITVNIPLQIGDGIDVVTTVSANVNSIVSSAYGNSNVASYMPTYTGSLANLTGDVTTPANVAAAKVSLGTGNLQLVGNTISSATSNITIDPLGDGTPAGNVVVAGNLQVAGTLTYNAVVNTTTNDLQWIAANNAASRSAATGAGLSVGPLGAYASFTYNSGSNAWQSSLPVIANGGVNANGALSGATTGAFSGNVTAPYFIGNGSQLTGLAPPSKIFNGASNVGIATNNGNITSYVNGQLVGRIATDRVSLGANAGLTGQGELSVAIGPDAGMTSQSQWSTAVGYGAGGISQGTLSVALGYSAGGTNQTSEAVAIGAVAGSYNQGSGAIAIGTYAASSDQPQGAIAIGYSSGGPGLASVTIGYRSGSTQVNNNAIGIGAYVANQANNSIVLNASGGFFNSTNSGFYVNPMRNDNANVTNSVYYNTSTKEVTYAPVAPTRASGRLIVGYGSYDAINSTTVDVGVPFTLPQAGTYLITYVCRTVLYAQGQYGVVTLTDMSNNTLQYSEVLTGLFAGSPVTNYQTTVTGTFIITVTGATQYKMRIRSAGAWTVTAISDGNGACAVTWAQIS